MTSAESAKSSIGRQRGMRDIFGCDAEIYHELSYGLSKIAKRFGFSRIETPIVEGVSLFKRSIGGATDIFQREMFKIEQPDGAPSSSVLRPEGTAGCVRAGIDARKFRHQVQRWFYHGPMFRRERPQSGRYRQFNQFGAELYGLQGAGSSVEIIMFTRAIIEEFGLGEVCQLEINYLGNELERTRYEQALVVYLKKLLEDESNEIIERGLANPLRLLDTKDSYLRSLLVSAPNLHDFFGEESTREFSAVQEVLQSLGVPYSVEKRLVRGLDYYNGLVFEWSSKLLGGQTALLGGGCYDSLVERLGGPATCAVGFALGIERLAILLSLVRSDLYMSSATPVMAVAFDGARSLVSRVSCMEWLRSALPNLKFLSYLELGRHKAVKLAEREGASELLIIPDTIIDLSVDSVLRLERIGCGPVVDLQVRELQSIY